jgi:hypothetical protein
MGVLEKRDYWYSISGATGQAAAATEFDMYHFSQKTLSIRFSVAEMLSRCRGLKQRRFLQGFSIRNNEIRLVNHQQKHLSPKPQPDLLGNNPSSHSIPANAAPSQSSARPTRLSQTIPARAEDFVCDGTCRRYRPLPQSLLGHAAPNKVIRPSARRDPRAFIPSRPDYCLSSRSRAEMRNASSADTSCRHRKM